MKNELLRTFGAAALVLSLQGCGNTPSPTDNRPTSSPALSDHRPIFTPEGRLVFTPSPDEIQKREKTLQLQKIPFASFEGAILTYRQSRRVGQQLTVRNLADVSVVINENVLRAWAQECNAKNAGKQILLEFPNTITAGQGQNARALPASAREDDKTVFIGFATDTILDAARKSVATDYKITPDQDFLAKQQANLTINRLVYEALCTVGNVPAQTPEGTAAQLRIAQQLKAYAIEAAILAGGQAPAIAIRTVPQGTLS